MFALEILTCILIADFATGLIHWLEDTYGREDWPWPLNQIALENIQHHQTPNDIRSGTFWTRNGPSILIAGTVFLVACATIGYSWHLAVIAAVGSMGNEIHSWSHGRRPPRPFGILQTMCLVQTARNHSIHHRAPYDVSYCTITNWLNPILDGIRFWRGLEWLLYCFGISVQRESYHRRGV